MFPSELLGDVNGQHKHLERLVNSLGEIYVPLKSRELENRYILHYDLRVRLFNGCTLTVRIIIDPCGNIEEYVFDVRDRSRLIFRYDKHENTHVQTEEHIHIGPW